MEGFLLGLASGVTCLAYCAPILVPYMLGEGRSIGQNYAILGQFLGGRLVGYLLFGLFSWLAGLALLQTASYHGIIFGSAYILLAGLLAVYGLFKAPSLCAQEPLRNALSRLLARRPALIPFSSGLLTGLNLCPPFLLAFARAAESGSLLDSLLLFLAFFVGTALYFLPMPFLGALRRVAALRTIGKLTALIVALYYLIIGVATLVGNLPHPAPRHGDYPPPSIAFDHRPRAGPTLGASTAGRVSRCTEAGGRSAQRGAAYRYGEQKPLPSMRASSAPPLNAPGPPNRRSWMARWATAESEFYCASVSSGFSRGASSFTPPMPWRKSRIVLPMALPRAGSFIGPKIRSKMPSTMSSSVQPNPRNMVCSSILGERPTGTPDPQTTGKAKGRPYCARKCSSRRSPRATVTRVPGRIALRVLAKRKE